MIEILEEHPAVFYVTTLVLGLIVGSFLNVVIHRLPVMLERAWRRECRSFLGLEEVPEPEPFNLLWPGSFCPRCRAPIRPWHNVPLLSYVLLRGRCAQCRGPIAPRYPLVEGLTALITLAVAWEFGVSPQLVPALVLSWSLIGLSIIDLDHQLLPDVIVLPMLWLGLLLSLAGWFTDSTASILGACAGYLILWLVFHGFKLLTGKEGMGYGDFKLLAMLGAWLGWTMLPALVLLSSTIGVVAGVLLIGFFGHARGNPLPFGPYLAIAGWICLLWGDDLNRAYLQWSGIAG